MIETSFITLKANNLTLKWAAPVSRKENRYGVYKEPEIVFEVDSLIIVIKKKRILYDLLKAFLPQTDDSFHEFVNFLGCNNRLWAEYINHTLEMAGNSVVEGIEIFEEGLKEFPNAYTVKSVPKVPDRSTKQSFKTKIKDLTEFYRENGFQESYYRSPFGLTLNLCKDGHIFEVIIKPHSCFVTHRYVDKRGITFNMGGLSVRERNRNNKWQSAITGLEITKKHEKNVQKIENRYESYSQYNDYIPDTRIHTYQSQKMQNKYTWQPRKWNLSFNERNMLEEERLTRLLSIS